MHAIIMVTKGVLIACKHASKYDMLMSIKSEITISRNSFIRICFCNSCLKKYKNEVSTIIRKIINAKYFLWSVCNDVVIVLIIKKIEKHNVQNGKFFAVYCLGVHLFQSDQC